MATKLEGHAENLSCDVTRIYLKLELRRFLYMTCGKVTQEKPGKNLTRHIKYVHNKALYCSVFFFAPYYHNISIVQVLIEFAKKIA
jgi:hypothetical protein